MNILQQLKQNAPSVYNDYKARKIPELKKQLDQLRSEYKEAGISDRVIIKEQANNIKNLLKNLV